VTAPASSAPATPGGTWIARRHGFGWIARLAQATGAAGTVAAATCALLALVAVLAPLLAPDSPNAVDVVNVFAGPSAGHLLGTDDVGRDLLSRLIYGARPSLAGPLLVTLASAAAGTFLGVAAAWCRGLADSLISRLFDLLLAFPGIVVAVLAATLFGAGFFAPVVALSISYVPVIGRVVRAAALTERSLPYIEALRLQGVSGWSACARHLVPNLAPLLLLQATVGFGYALLDLAAISYLGLGIQPPAPDWGVMVANGQSAIFEGYPQQALYAVAVIIVAVVAVNLLGERLALHFELGDRA
jgi:peptide/nickel transport system permease protein